MEVEVTGWYLDGLVSTPALQELSITTKLMNICEKGNKYLYLTLFYRLFIRGPLGRLKLLFLPPVLHTTLLSDTDIVQSKGIA
jgi:hypothetical protein